MLQKLTPLMGYDNRGLVYEADEFILRKISDNYLQEAKSIYSLYKNFELQTIGVVESFWDESSQTLRHKKHPITYPHEWTVSMFKDAVLFHLKMFIELDKYELTLKDAIPNNIVFDYGKPIFVDFLSILKKDNLSQEFWLKEGKNNNLKDLRFTIFDKMFLPFIYIPFVLISIKKYTAARNILLNMACNNEDGKCAGWANLIDRDNFFSSLLYIYKLRLFYKLNKRHRFIDFAKNLYEQIAAENVMPQKSAYVSYYQGKKEKFEFEDKIAWKSKQLNIYKLITNYNPKTVLDLGANTGWFSVLAAKNGAKVIATDIDESCIDLLYCYAKSENLPIISLFLPFENLVLEKYGIIVNEQKSMRKNVKASPLFISATKRLNSDMVLCLALTHHLILGMGMDIDEIMKILSSLSNKILILEFVSLDDNLIRGEPSFFKNLYKFSHDTYNLNIFISIGKKYFTDCEVLDSNSDTRKLLVFKK